MYTVNFAVKYGHGSIETFSHVTRDLKWYLQDIIGAYKLDSILIKDESGKIIIRKDRNVEKFIKEFCEAKNETF